jgi:hydrogenase/urease accessory protein HupE
MTDQQRMIAALVLFVVGAVVAFAVSAVAGAVLTVLGIAALLWGRKVGDNRPKA